MRESAGFNEAGVYCRCSLTFSMTELGNEDDESFPGVQVN